MEWWEVLKYIIDIVQPIYASLIGTSGPTCVMSYARSRRAKLSWSPSLEEMCPRMLSIVRLRTTLFFDAFILEYGTKSAKSNCKTSHFTFFGCIYNKIGRV
jgi:hypothetical protein